LLRQVQRESFFSLSHLKVARSLTIFSSNLLASTLDIVYPKRRSPLFANPASRIRQRLHFLQVCCLNKFEFTQLKMLLHDGKFLVDSLAHAHIEFDANPFILLLFAIPVNSHHIELVVSQFDDRTSA
jgi:hypothetical protein